MSDNSKPKRFKTLDSFFSRSSSGTSTNPCPSSASPAHEDLNHSTPSQPPIERTIESSLNQSSQEFDTNHLERDPGLRPQICTYPAKRRDEVRLSYILLGPCQPKLAEYPAHKDGTQNHRDSFGSS